MAQQAIHHNAVDRRRSFHLEAGMEPLPGYKLRCVRGRGGYAEVWEADGPNDVPCALKFISGLDGMAAPREIRAVQAIRQLQHQGIVLNEQVWCYKSYIVIAMELADASLQDLLEAYYEETQGPIEPEKICCLLTQAADALDYLHERRHAIGGKCVSIQHCDIKPSNLLLFGDVVKLTDFGLSSTISSNLQAHRRAGTLDYAAPEVFQGRLSEHTDQYALAVSYYQLRTGQLPFADTPKSFSRAYTRPRPDLKGLKTDEEKIIAKALAPTPQNRFPNCLEMMQQLSRIWV